MSDKGYRSVLAQRDVRSALLLGLLMRIPLWGGLVIMTLHVVGHLHHSYTAAGILGGVATVATGISSPIRGRLLDRRGLRRTVGPSLVVLTACWSVAPWVGYAVLLPIVFVAGLFTVPSFTIVRQQILAATTIRQRKSALSLDSVATELSFMIGPPLGVVAATYLDTSWALLMFELLSVAAAGVLFVQNPPMRSAAELDAQQTSTGRAPTTAAGGSRTWLTPAIRWLLICSLASVLVLTGGSLATIAALRSMGYPNAVGWVLGVWGAGSAIGGLIYGTIAIRLKPAWLLSVLGATQGLAALADEPYLFTVLLFVSGLFVAPTLTSITEQITEYAPVEVRGEVMGWQGTALTGGDALAAPLTGVFIDQWGWQAGLIGGSSVGVFVGLIGMAGRLPRAGAPARACSADA